MTAFQKQIAANVSATIRRMKAGGTISMSRDNLRQVTPTPPATLDGAPRGGNLQWQYAQAFNGVVDALPVARRFLLS